LQPIIDEQAIPLNNVAFSLYPCIFEPHDCSSSSSSQTLDMVLQSPEMLSPSPSDDRTAPSLHISVSEESDVSDHPMYTGQRHFVSSPTSVTRRLQHHRQLGYHSDSTESTDKLGSGEISRLSLARDMTLVAGTSQLSIDLSTRLSHEGTKVSSLTCVEDESTIDIYPVAPENFKRHEKRRKM
jgi:hypothetical protein